jgi:hypothetical protein
MPKAELKTTKGTHSSHVLVITEMLLEQAPPRPHLLPSRNGIDPVRSSASRGALAQIAVRFERLHRVVEHLLHTSELEPQLPDLGRVVAVCLFPINVR